MTFISAIQFFLLALVTFFVGIPATAIGLLLPGRFLKGKLSLIVSKSFSHAAFAVFGIRVEARGLSNIDPSRPYVFMANHVSHADSSALIIAIPQPLFWVFKKELAKIPVFGWALLATGQIMVDRSDSGQSRASLESAARRIEGNGSIAIYPEGTRSRDGALLPLKKGGFRIAVSAGLPIVPAKVSGSREIVAAGTLRVRPGTVTVEIFPPIPTEGKTQDDFGELMEKVREALSSGTPGPA